MHLQRKKNQNPNHRFMHHQRKRSQNLNHQYMSLPRSHHMVTIQDTLHWRSLN
ncbi:hypothetical protein Gohar_008317, partial [Gossypium harknessii]|nr:hypothetical protein [Gossypium harknessii]